MQLVVIYIISQLIFFRKLTRTEIVLLSAAYVITVISVLFLRYNVINMQGVFRFSPFTGNWPISWNPISFIFDAADDRSSILVSLLNVFLFVPLKPILAANKLPHKWWIVITCFGAIEWLQYILQTGSFDLGDIVLYFAGYLAGYGFVKLYENMNCKTHSTEQSIKIDD